MTDEVQTVKRQKRESERIWQTSKWVVHRLIYKEYCIKLNVAITYAKYYFIKMQLSTVMATNVNFSNLYIHYWATENRLYFLHMMILLLSLLHSIIIL